MATQTTALQIPISMLSSSECPSCVERLRDALLEMRGVDELVVDEQRLTLTLRYDPNLASLEQIEARAHDVGVRIEEHFGHETYDLVGLDCPDCATKLEKAVASLPGVLWAAVSFAASVIHVEYEADVVSRDAIMARIEAMGYTTRQAVASGRRPPESIRRRTTLTVVCGALLVAGAAASLTALDARVTTVFYALSIVVGGYYAVKAAYYSLLTRALDMNVLMTVAVLGAVYINEWSEAATVVFLFAVGNALESFAIDRTRASIRSLMDLAPPVALVRRDGVESRIPVAVVRVGDLVIVRPGERIPMDGRVAGGASSVNQAPITGESASIAKQVGDEIFAGTINETGALEVIVTRTAEDNTIARIVHLVEEAQAQKAPAQRFVDRFSRYYTPSVIAIAAAVATVPPLLLNDPFDDWFYRALVMLVISCPCALVISTPVSIVSAIGNASRNGVLVKGGAYLEEMAHVGTIAFDKTGTLTTGVPEVSDVVPAPGRSERDVLAAAAAVERRSEHPLADAVTRAAEALGIVADENVEGFRAIVGRGAVAQVGNEELVVGSVTMFEKMSVDLDALHAEADRLQRDGKTVVVVGSRAGVVGLVALSDTLREESGPAIAALRKAGIDRVLMLTGDNARTASAIAAKLGVDGYLAELMPQDKVTAVKRLRADGVSVAMVGDGINDAPALAAASAGIAMGAGGSETALETADIALVASDLRKLPYVVTLSRRALRVVKQNVTLSLVIKVGFLLVTAIGLTSLWLAVVADTGTSLLVTANGLRLLRTKAD